MSHHGRPHGRDGEGCAEQSEIVAGEADPPQTPALTAHRASPKPAGMIPMLKRYGDEADIESALRAEELAEEGDHNGAAVWRRVTDAIEQLTNTTPPGPVH
jgi:hypothetical protein